MHKYFDEFFADATSAGITQVVILASGLDARGYRLPWPAGTTIYELDLPKVLKFKADVLTHHRIEPTATINHVAVDLRHDWPAAITAAGFDSSTPTAWLAEGLLPFLPGDAQDSLFEDILQLSGPASRFAGEYFIVPSDQAAAQQFHAMSPGGVLRRMYESFVDDGAAPPSLVFGGQHLDPAEWLRRHDWSVNTTTIGDIRRAAQVATGHSPALAEATGRTHYFTAVGPNAEPVSFD